MKRNFQKGKRNSGQRKKNLRTRTSKNLAECEKKLMTREDELKIKDPVREHAGEEELVE